MAICSVCGKGVSFGHNVSHSNRKTNRVWKPNIRKVKAVVNGTNKQRAELIITTFIPLRYNSRMNSSLQFISDIVQIIFVFLVSIII